MSSVPTDHSGQGAISLGLMVVVCEAFERSVAQNAAEILEANGIPALLQSSEDGPVSYTHLTLPTNREV